MYKTLPSAHTYQVTAGTDDYLWMCVPIRMLTHAQWLCAFFAVSSVLLCFENLDIGIFRKIEYIHVRIVKYLASS